MEYFVGIQNLGVCSWFDAEMIHLLLHHSPEMTKKEEEEEEFNSKTKNTNKRIEFSYRPHRYDTFFGGGGLSNNGKRLKFYFHFVTQ